MPFRAFPLAFLAHKRIDASDSRRALWDDWINDRQVAALLHIPLNRVHRLAGKRQIPTAVEHSPSGRLLWWPGDVLAAAERLPKCEVPQWLEEAAVAAWLGIAIDRLQQLVTAGHLPGPTRLWRGSRFWRPDDVRTAVVKLPGGLASTFDGL